MAPTLEVAHLRKTFGTVVAVDDVSFAIQEGEIYGLLGANGAGKTTTIQMLLGVTTPDSGSITVFGKSLAAERGTILQQTNFSSSYVSLPWNLSVEENLRVFARLYSVAHAGERIIELLRLFDLERHRKTITGKLSSGQLTRLFLAKALINRPRLLLLDEPTASLDPDIADRTRQTLMKLAAEDHVTMLYTSHNMSEIESMCDRVGFLHHGMILTEGTPDEIIRQYGKQNLEDVFLHIARTPKEAA